MSGFSQYLRALAILLGIITVAAGCQRPSTSTETSEAQQSSVTPHPADSATHLFELVDHYYKNLDHDSLADLTPKAMAYFRDHQLWTEYYSTWCLYVNDLVWNGQMDQGFEEAQKMHNDAIGRDNAFGLSEAYIAMGIAYHFQKNDLEAANCYKQALEHYPEDGSKSVKLNIYSYYCQVLVDLKDFPANAEVLDKWHEYLHQLTDGQSDNPQYNHWHFRFHRENYRYYYAIGNYKKAAQELDSMQVFLNKVNDREIYEAQTAGFRTQLAVVQKDYTNAMIWSDREIKLSSKQDFNTFLNALKHRTEMLQTLGHFEEALKAYRDYDQQKDSLIKADNREQLNELNKRFEVDELKAQQERSRLEHEREQLQLTLILAAVIVIGLIFIIILHRRSNKRLKEAHTLLEKSNKELQESYEQLKVANAKAEESSKMKSDFIHQISHEIRTPLNVLSGFTQILTTPGIELDDEQKKDVSKRITENTDRITRLVNKMLELSETNSQAVIKQEDEVSISQIAIHAVNESGIKENPLVKFELHTDEQSNTTIIKTNLTKASRALCQLLDNAQKFLNDPDNKNKQAREGRVWLTTKIGPQAVSFTIEDTGIGFPIYEAEHIFDEFVQLNEYYDGTGIGLTVARNIARRLGGDVIADTTYSPGARFIMILPL